MSLCCWFIELRSIRPASPLELQTAVRQDVLGLAVSMLTSISYLCNTTQRHLWQKVNTVVASHSADNVFFNSLNPVQTLHFGLLNGPIHIDWLLNRHQGPGASEVRGHLDQRLWLKWPNTFISAENWPLFNIKQGTLHLYYEKVVKLSNICREKLIVERIFCLICIKNIWSHFFIRHRTNKAAFTSNYRSCF